MKSRSWRSYFLPVEIQLFQHFCIIFHYIIFVPLVKTICQSWPFKYIFTSEFFFPVALICVSIFLPVPLTWLKQCYSHFWNQVILHLFSSQNYSGYFNVWWMGYSSPLPLKVCQYLQNNPAVILIENALTL